MNILSRECILSEVASVKSGTFTRVGYRTELPVKAQYKKEGVQFFKYTEASLRFGVNYGRISSVIARKAEEQLADTVQRANNYEWIIPNKARHNIATGKDYVFAANFNQGANIHNVYVGLRKGKVFSIIPESKEMFKQLNEEYMIPSYWKDGGSAPEVMNISFTNIYRIGNKGPRFASVIDHFVAEYGTAVNA